MISNPTKDDIDPSIIALRDEAKSKRMIDNWITMDSRMRHFLYVPVTQNLDPSPLPEENKSKGEYNGYYISSID
jgi:hypothetical protein